jgi:hypothetical protein
MTSNELSATQELLASSLQTNHAMGNKLRELDELLRQCAVSIKQMAKDDWARMIAKGHAHSDEPDSAAIRLYDTLKYKGYVA